MKEHTNKLATQSSFVPPTLQLKPRPFMPQQSKDIEQGGKPSQQFVNNSQETLYIPKNKFIANNDQISTENVMQRKWDGIVQRFNEEVNAASNPSQEYTSAQGAAEDVMQRKWDHVKQRYHAKRGTESTNAISVQTKLAVGAVGDKYEQEANSVAAQVVQEINQPQTHQPVQRTNEKNESDQNLQMKPLANIQRFDPPGEEKPKEEEDLLQMKPTSQRVGRDGGDISQDLESEIQSARGRGSALDVGLQRSMGQAMGADFSGVKIHTDAQSDQLNHVLQAKAFTTGSDVFFRGRVRSKQ